MQQVKACFQRERPNYYS